MPEPSEPPAETPDETRRGFPKSLRLLSSRQFQPVFDDATFRVGSGELLILARPNHLEHPRLGLVMGKKNLKHAIMRNRVKRVLREGFRLRQHELPALDCVVIARRGAQGLDTTALHSVCDRLWTKLSKKANT